jgi:hypothetical protein
MKIQFKTGTDGRRDIFIEKHDNKEPGTYELNIDDNNGKEKIKLMNKKADPDKFKGKTDDEIREMVKEDLGAPDMKDSDIQITRDGDKVQVKVNHDEKEAK